jgi:hypothetical protein
MRLSDDVLTFTGCSRAGSGLRRVSEANPPAERRAAVWRRPSWRPNAPSARARRADMSRTAFMVLLIGWVTVVAMIPAVSLALR